MKKLYNLIVFSFLCFAANAQTVNIFGLSTSGNIVVGGSSYHASESIYTNAEIGTSNFTTNAIQKINFYLQAEGFSPAISNFRIRMKNISAATTTFTSGTYSLTGYTTVFDGTLNATPTGIVGVTLSTPFIRTAGSNLQVLIERTDNVVHTGIVFYSAIGNAADAAALTTRRYNNTTIPTPGTSNLTASAFRPAIQFVHQYAIDAAVTDISSLNVTCFDAPQTLSVELTNDGLNDIAAGAAAVTLAITGANTFSSTLSNTNVIAPGASEIISFAGINLSNAGDNDEAAYVNLTGDGTTLNDSLFNLTTTATTLSTYPIVEDAETTLPVFGWVNVVAGDAQLWTLQTGKYANLDQVDSLAPKQGETFYLFDSYSGSNSAGFVSRLFSNCIALPTPLAPNPAPVTTVDFWMSRDAVFATSFDSLFLSISTDKGATWTRLAGFQRADATAAVPYWKNEIVDISAYNGQTVQLAFEGQSDFGNIIGLDSIVINYTGLAPVTLMSFDAKRIGTANHLNWSTTQEINTNKFAVERSNDGLNFSTIGFVQAANNSNGNDYRYIDANPVKGINYYRLRMIDNDNSYKFSSIKNVRNLGLTTLSVHPNPVVQNMTAVLESETKEKVTLTIADLSGRRIFTTTAQVNVGNNKIAVPATQLAKGSYILLVNMNGQTLTQKINKL